MCFLQENILRTLCAQTTAAVQRACYNQLATMLDDVLYGAVCCFYRTLGSAIEDRAGICELLSALCVIHATGADNQRCCAAAAAAAVLCFGQRWQQQSSSAIVAGSREGNSAYPPSAVIICHAYCCCLY